MINNVFGKEVKTQQQQQQNKQKQHKRSGQSRELNAGPLVSQSGALPLGH